MTTPRIGHGAKVQFSTDGGTTWVTLKGVTQAGFGSSKADVLETTAFDTPGIDKTFVGGLFDPGDYSVKLNTIPGDSSQGIVRGWAGDSTTHLFKHTDSSNIEARTFKAFVTGFDEDTQNDKIATYSVKLKVAEAITYGAAAAPTALSYSAPTVSVAHGTPMTADVPTVTGLVDTFSVSPSLPSGLSIDASTGIISGTPASALAGADYTVTATNTVGTTTAVVHITVT